MKIETIKEAVKNASALADTLRKLIFKEAGPIEAALLQTIFGVAVDLEIKLKCLEDAAKQEGK